MSGEEVDLISVVARGFLTLNSGVLFKPNWNLDAIARALDDVMAGRMRRLIITPPPGSPNLKSISASVSWPALLHGRDPSKSCFGVQNWV